MAVVGAIPTAGSGAAPTVGGGAVTTSDSRGMSTHGGGTIRTAGSGAAPTVGGGAVTTSDSRGMSMPGGGTIRTGESRAVPKAGGGRCTGGRQRCGAGRRRRHKPTPGDIGREGAAAWATEGRVTAASSESAQAGPAWHLDRVAGRCQEAIIPERKAYREARAGLVVRNRIGQMP